jgi:hypothetical protein
LVLVVLVGMKPMVLHRTMKEILPTALVRPLAASYQTVVVMLVQVKVVMVVVVAVEVEV